jgi:hypothetical protein
MRLAFLVLAVAAAGCGGARPAEPSPRAGGSRADTAPPRAPAPRFCPKDTEQVGAEPPAGGVVWCEDADGRKQGPYRSWYDSGELEEEGQFQDGKRVGLWRFFDEKGELKGTRTFRLRVRVKVCVYEKSSRRALERTMVQVTNLETLDSSTVFTDPAGMAAVEIDSGRGRIEVAGLFPHVEVRADLEGTGRPIAVALDSAAVQKILRINMGRLASASSCAR